MQERIARSKAAFWLFFVVFLGLAAAPSVVLIKTLESYFRFLTGWNPGILRAVPVRHIPHRGGTASGRADAQLHFVEFRLKSPKAKKVSLGADFNRWMPETLPLGRSRRDYWSVVVPLPAGKYEYLFSVDGAWVQDPKASESGTRGGLKTSIRQVP